jgi:hypothetical protein
MKQCRTCNRTYTDDTQSFCLEDGTPLTTTYDPEATQVISPAPRSRPDRRTNPLIYVVIALLALIAAGGLVVLLKSGNKEAQVSAAPTPKPSVEPNASTTSPIKQSTPMSEREPKPSPTRTPDRVFGLPATRAGWSPIGSGSFTIEVSGQIDFGGITSTPEGVRRTGEGVKNALAPELPFGAVIAKIGDNGRPLVVGYSHRFDTEERVYIAINDSDYSDNSGSYRIRVRY